jgi:hypothetical protein
MGVRLKASGVADDFALPGAVRSGSFTAGMELREFAERVVFGTTLEEKLFRPETFTDTRPGSAWGPGPTAGPARPSWKAPGGWGRDAGTRSAGPAQAPLDRSKGYRGST